MRDGRLMADELTEVLAEKDRRIADLEADNLRLAKIMYETAHVAATLGTAHEGWLRGRFMSISNALNAGIGRPQSSHGMQFDRNGNEIKTA